MIKKIFFSILVVIQSLAWAETEAKVKRSIYPRVGSLQGDVRDLQSEKRPQLKEKQTLLEKALIQVGPKSKVRIDLDEFSSVIIFENSNLEIPVITWGEGEVFQLNLIRGQIRYNCEKNCKRRVSTALSSEIFTNGESLLIYEPNSPRVELIVLHGEQSFRGLENEESFVARPGQKMVFQGLKEGEEVAYDLLLKGRKVARGKMQPAFEIKKEDLAALEKETQFKKSVLTNAQKVANKKLPSQICEKPFAELNQCVWELEKHSKTKCLRKRCNANGEWSDIQEQTGSTHCQARKPVVGACDY